MRTRSSSNLVGESSPNPTTSNPKRRNRRRSRTFFSLKISLDTMADQRTMAELLRVPTEGYAEAIVVLLILAEHFKLKHSLINMMTLDQFFGLEKDNPHDHIHWFNKITSIIKYKDVPNSAIKLMPFPFFLGGSHRSDRKNNPRSLPGNTIANPKGELKAITTRSGLVLDGSSVSMPPPFINSEEDEHAEETLTDPELAEYTIKVPPPLFQKAKPPSLRNYVVHQRDPLHPNIPYPLRMNKEKQQDNDEKQIHKFWQMFKQLHINISLADALILIPKYQKMLKSLLSNKEKLLELANTPLNENCSAVILKKLLEKLGDPGKFLIPFGFSELKCKSLADLANLAICTPAGIARDVFVPVGKFTFPADFVIVDYESNPRVPLILGRPFLRTGRALIDVHEEEMILHNGDERLILNMRHDTSSYSNKPKKESINMIDIYNVSHEDYLEDLFSTNHLSGNPTPISDPIVSSSPTLTSLEESDLIWEEFEAYLISDSFPPRSDDTDFDPKGDVRLIEELLNNDPSSPLPLSHNPLSGSTTSSSPDHLLEEFPNELTLITFPPRK
ncbi:reverse transcriptase domain-containing protein [Tanacetum coccineum]